VNLPAQDAETNTVVVGASVAGLAAAACLQRARVPFVLLERSPRLAATWRGHYDRLHLHTSRALSGLPFFGFPRSFPRYPSRDQVVAYLEDYAAHFQLAPRFGQGVTQVRRDGEHWLTATGDGAYRSRHVVIATGYTGAPRLPTWPGLASFGGQVLHSSAYRNGRAFAGQDVLVVGMGNSGAEIALDLWEHGARVAIAVRSPVNVVPREFLGIPIDGWALLMNLFPAWLGDAISATVGRLRYGSLARFGLRKAAFGPVTGFRRHGVVPIIDVGTLARVRKGEITIAPPVAAFSPGQAHFEGGLQRPVQAVVLATGFRPALDSLLAGATLDADGGPLGADRRHLPFVPGAPGLFLCGFRVNLTGMFRKIGGEARQIARTIRHAG
jgi:indole-3-pyruvate monooxygenase